jgi:hypothetical protein
VDAFGRSSQWRPPIIFQALIGMASLSTVLYYSEPLAERTALQKLVIRVRVVGPDTSRIMQRRCRVETFTGVNETLLRNGIIPEPIKRNKQDPFVLLFFRLGAAGEISDLVFKPGGRLDEA